MYLFMKGVGFTHMNLKGKCMIVYNHWKKSVKIDCAWRTFVESQILKVTLYSFNKTLKVYELGIWWYKVCYLGQTFG